MPAKSSRMDRTGTQSTKQQQKLDVKIYGDGAAAGIGSQKKKPPPPTPSRHSTGLKHTKGGPPMQLKQPPIIIVPESDSAIVSLFNAKELLQVCHLSARCPPCVPPLPHEATAYGMGVLLEPIAR